MQAAGAPTLVADGERGEPLDWWAFDAAPQASLGSGAGGTAATITAVPRLARYAGMPATRFWQFEDTAVSFGQVDVDPTDLGRMLLIEFALGGADDWHVIALPIAVGAVATVAQLRVLDTFGRATEIEPVDDGPADGPRWRMFRVTQRRRRRRGAAARARRPQRGCRAARRPGRGPAPGPRRAGQPGVGDRARGDRRPRRRDGRRRRPGPGRPPRRGSGHARLRRADAGPGGVDAARPAAVRRTAASSSPAALWPRRRPPSRRGDSPTRSSLLREEALPREGLTVRRRWHVARWIDGSLHAWVGREVLPGAGEPESGWPSTGSSDPVGRRLATPAVGFSVRVARADARRRSRALGQRRCRRRRRSAATV